MAEDGRKEEMYVHKVADGHQDTERTRVVGTILGGENFEQKCQTLRQKIRSSVTNSEIGAIEIDGGTVIFPVRIYLSTFENKQPTQISFTVEVTKDELYLILPKSNKDRAVDTLQPLFNINEILALLRVNTRSDLSHPIDQLRSPIFGSRISSLFDLHRDFAKINGLKSYEDALLGAKMILGSSKCKFKLDEILGNKWKIAEKVDEGEDSDYLIDLLEDLSRCDLVGSISSAVDALAIDLQLKVAKWKKNEQSLTGLIHLSNYIRQYQQSINRFPVVILAENALYEVTLDNNSAFQISINGEVTEIPDSTQVGIIQNVFIKELRQVETQLQRVEKTMKLFIVNLVKAPLKPLEKFNKVVDLLSMYANIDKSDDLNNIRVKERSEWIGEAEVLQIQLLLSFLMISALTIDEYFLYGQSEFRRNIGILPEKNVPLFQALFEKFENEIVGLINSYNILSKNSEVSIHEWSEAIGSAKIIFISALRALNIQYPVYEITSKITAIEKQYYNKG